jgi:3-deoxy-D-arabino-heptulosonate 7-phosphate (DAHP) synthase
MFWILRLAAARSSPWLVFDGLKMLARARQESGLAIVTEVMPEDDVPMVAEYADILQIGSRSMENYAPLEASAYPSRPILLKRDMMATLADMLRSAQMFMLDPWTPSDGLERTQCEPAAAQALQVMP